VLEVGTGLREPGNDLPLEVLVEGIAPGLLEGGPCPFAQGEPERGAGRRSASPVASRRMARAVSAGPLPPYPHSSPVGLWTGTWRRGVRVPACSTRTEATVPPWLRKVLTPM
jgi:hypothetical protein